MADAAMQEVPQGKPQKTRAEAEKIRAEVLDLSRGMRSRLMASAREMVTKSVVDDPDIWGCAKALTEAAVEQFLVDLEHEFEAALENVVFQQADGGAVPGPSTAEGPLAQKLWYRFRALILNHYLPYNRSFYGKFKDPLYLLMYGATLIPIHGIRVCFFTVILAMLLAPQPPDEHQLINFILIFKGMQFLTSGLIYMARGSMQYFACYSFHKASLLECIDASGPGASATWGQLVDYLGSVVLVWIAFFILPKARKYKFRPQSTDGSQPLLPGAGRERDTGSHNRLRRLLYYDMACFSTSILALCTLTAQTCADSWQSGVLALGADMQFHSNIFWCCVLYSLLSLPFTLFTLPGLQKVLTHSNPTGFNRHGACVAFALPSAAAQQAAAGEAAAEQQPDRLTHLATNVAATILRTAAKGRVHRGGNDDGEYQKGDFRRGVWVNMTDAFGKLKEKTTDVSPLPHAPSSSSSTTTPSGTQGRIRPLMNLNRLFPPRRDNLESPSSPLHAEPPLIAAAVRILPGDFEPQKEGPVAFKVEVLADCSLDGAAGDPVQVARQHGDFAVLASRLTARAARAAGSSPGGQAAMPPPPPLPQQAAKARSWVEMEAQRRELGDWLEKVVDDQRSQGTWASELRAFLGLAGESSYGAQAGGGAAGWAAAPSAVAEEYGEGDEECGGEAGAMKLTPSSQSDEKTGFRAFIKSLRPRHCSAASAASSDAGEPGASATPEGAPADPALAAAAADAGSAGGAFGERKPHGRGRHWFGKKVAPALQSVYDFIDPGTAVGGIHEPLIEDSSESPLRDRNRGSDDVGPCPGPASGGAPPPAPRAATPPPEGSHRDARGGGRGAEDTAATATASARAAPSPPPAGQAKASPSREPWPAAPPAASPAASPAPPATDWPAASWPTPGWPANPPPSAPAAAPRPAGAPAASSAADWPSSGWPPAAPDAPAAALTQSQARAPARAAAAASPWPADWPSAAPARPAAAEASAATAESATPSRPSWPPVQSSAPWPAQTSLTAAGASGMGFGGASEGRPPARAAAAAAPLPPSPSAPGAAAAAGFAAGFPAAGFPEAAAPAPGATEAWAEASAAAAAPRLFEKQRVAAEAVGAARTAIHGTIQERLGANAVSAARAAMDQRLDDLRSRMSDRMSAQQARWDGRYQKAP